MVGRGERCLSSSFHNKSRARSRALRSAGRGGSCRRTLRAPGPGELRPPGHRRAWKKNAPALCASPRDWKTGKNGMWSCVSEQPGFQVIPSEIPITSPSRSPPRNAWDAKYFCFKTRGAILHPNESQGFGSIGCHAGFPPPNPAGWAVLCCSQLGWT